MVSPVPTPRSKTVIIGHPLSNSQRRTTLSTGYPVFYHPNPATSTTNTNTNTNTVTAVSSAPSSILFRLLASATAALLLASVFAVLLFLILHPRLPSLRVDSSELDNSSNNNSTRLSLTLLFVNPNRKLTLSYSNLDMFLRYGFRGDVASIRLPPFSQATSEETRVRAQLLLGEGIGGDGEKGKNGTVMFGVTVFASVRFGAGKLRSGGHALKALCYPVIVVFDRSGEGNNGTGTMAGPSDWCVV